MSDKKHNDPLEDLFKEKVNDPDIAYQESDWLALEKKMDEKAAYVTRQKRIRLAAAAAIIFMSLIGYFTYQNYNNINSLNEKLEGQITQNEPSEPQAETPQEQPQPIPDPETSEEPEGIDPVEPDEPLNDPIAQVTEKEGESSESDIETTEANNLNEQKVVFNSDLKNRLVSVSNVDEESILPSLSRGSQLPDLPLYAAVSASGDRTGIVHSGNRISDEQALNTGSRLNIGIVVSPDLSTAGGIRQFEQPGYKFGIRTGYQLTPNISIETGIIRSSVRYSAGIGSYDPPGYQNNPNNLSSIYAECMILDIPLNVTFNFWNLSNSRFFASAGLSSYVMLSEDYTFSYDYSYYGQETNYSERSGKAHLFSNSSLSIGYEYDIHKNWSLSAEPFIKVPLKEVGWGNARLYTLGTFVTLNYRL
ncbi:MAG TPA: hypothetical protein VJ941_08445 [Gracilimonas sp.]|nr:hypothetical protein [Gracilimonas sp.]